MLALRCSQTQVDLTRVKQELLEAAESGQRGLNATEDIRRRLEAAVTELEEAGREQCTTDALLSATSVTPSFYYYFFFVLTSLPFSIGLYYRALSSCCFLDETCGTSGDRRLAITDIIT